jgi:hypothetical protein
MAQNLTSRSTPPANGWTTLFPQAGGREEDFLTFMTLGNNHRHFSRVEWQLILQLSVLWAPETSSLLSSLLLHYVIIRHEAIPKLSRSVCRGLLRTLQQ